MVCPSCNAAIGPEVRFCPKCGAPAMGAPLPPFQGPPQSYAPPYATQLVPRLRVTRNLQALGILWCVYGAYRILAGLAGMFFLRAVTTHGFGVWGWPSNGHMPPQFPPAWMSFLIPVIAMFTILSAALAFATGYSLLTRRPWGRVLSIVAAVLALLKFPLGTALAIYTLWIMVPAESGMEYDSITAQPYRA